MAKIMSKKIEDLTYPELLMRKGYILSKLEGYLEYAGYGYRTIIEDEDKWTNELRKVEEKLKQWE